MNNEFWMPAPWNDWTNPGLSPMPHLTAAERAVLRRLRKGERPRKAARRVVRLNHKAAIRRRRRALDRLGLTDVKSLVQIVMELGL